MVSLKCGLDTQRVQRSSEEINVFIYLLLVIPVNGININDVINNYYRIPLISNEVQKSLLYQ